MELSDSARRLCCRGRHGLPRPDVQRSRAWLVGRTMHDVIDGWGGRPSVWRAGIRRHPLPAPNHGQGRHDVRVRHRWRRCAARPGVRSGDRAPGAIRPVTSAGVPPAGPACVPMLAHVRNAYGPIAGPAAGFAGVSAAASAGMPVVGAADERAEGGADARRGGAADGRRPAPLTTRLAAVSTASENSHVPLGSRSARCVTTRSASSCRRPGVRAGSPGTRRLT